MDMNGKNMKDYMTTIKQQHEANVDKQDAILIAINGRLDDTNRLIDSGNSVTNKIADALRLDWLRQLGTELKGYMRRIIAMNIATYHAVNSIQSALPGRLERGLIEEPFILEDAVGRIAPVHLQFVTSWDAFNAVLEIRFREMQGFNKVKQKQYGLQDKATKRDIEQTRPWQRAFLPGQRIEMSFLFDARDNQGGVSDVTCPGCQTTSTNSTDTEVQCENCRMWFRRITIIQDVEPQPQVPVPSPWRSKSEFGKAGFGGMVSGPARPGKKRVTPADVDGEDDLREFKRVRLITRKERTRMQAFERRKGSQGLRTFSTLSTTKPESSEKTWKSQHGERIQAKGPEYERLQSPSITQPLDLVEMVKKELIKARETGLLSKAVPSASTVHTGETWDSVTRMNIDRVASAREVFWNSRWFPQQAPEAAESIQQIPEPIVEEHQHSKLTLLDIAKIGRKELLKMRRVGLGSKVTQYSFVEESQCAPHPEIRQVQQVPHLDPAHITLEELKRASEYLDGTGLTFAKWFHDTIWPPRSMTAYLSTGLILGHHELDCSLITTANALYGTPFRFPNTDIILYGSTMGRWIFDWTCHYYSNKAILMKATQVWDRICTLEDDFVDLVHSQDRRNADDPGTLWGISKDADMLFSHFIACYRCFWWQLLSIMTEIRLQDRQCFKGIATSTVNTYTEAFLKRFFFPTPWDVCSGYDHASRLLDLCVGYLRAGVAVLESVESEEEENIGNTAHEDKS
jgi:hypothetical protein